MKRPAGWRERHVLMDSGRLSRTLARMAAEIAERQPEEREAVLVGIRTRGVPLARRLAGLLSREAAGEPAVGALDITLYRDDLTTIAAQPVMKGTDIPVSIDGRTVVLVDDVLYTGRTVRAALDELIDFGRPSRIELAVLVDRGHRELPIRADYVGEALTTTRDESIQVLLEEEDGEDRVLLLEKEPPRRSRKATQRPTGTGTRRKARKRTGSPRGGRSGS
jgi:pyrimidine operon attenuation protein/uracil phosphoribosyltransferase